MSWIDKNDMFYDGSEAAITATGISSVKQVAAGNVGLSPQSNAIVDLGGTENLWLVLVPTVTGTGAGTVTFTLLSDSTADLATTPTTHWTSAALVGTTMVAGTPIAAFPLPSGRYEKFLGIKHTVASTVGALKLNGYLTNSYDAVKYYAAGSIIGV